MIYKPIYSLKIYTNNYDYFVVTPRYISEILLPLTTQFEMATEQMTGVAETTNIGITLLKPAAGQFTELENFLKESAPWRMTLVEIFYTNDGIAGNLKLAGTGLIFTRTEDRTKVAFVMRGFLDLFNINLVETPLFRGRKVATPIPSTVSVANLKAQDPTIKEGSSAGLINTLLWLIGGRPYKYKSLYTSQDAYVAGQYPKFFFDCQASVINPEWAWFNYENLTEDIKQLCKASGGLLSQDLDGVIRYKNVFGSKKTWNGLTITDSLATKFTQSERGSEPYSKVIITYTPRYLAGSQEIYSTVLNEYLNRGESVERQLDFTRPVYKMVNKTISGQLTDTIVGSNFKFVKDTINAVDIFGTKQTMSVKLSPHNILYIPKYVASGTLGNFTVEKDTAVISSQTTTLTVSNTLNPSTIFVGEVSLYGRTLEAGSQETFIRKLNQFPTISGFKELRLPDNPYVQSESQAVRLVDTAKYLLENPRVQITADNVPFVSGIALGETVKIYSQLYTLSGEYQITGISFSNSIQKASITLLSLSGIYGEDEIFIIGQSYSLADQRKLSI
jgi:hypothetical protein